MALTGQPVEVTAMVLVPRYVITDPNLQRAAIRGMTSAGEQILTETLGRPVRRYIQVVAVLYGCLTDETGHRVPFHPMPCPEATHARVTVRLIEGEQ